jgi:hypothetical protein
MVSFKTKQNPNDKRDGFSFTIINVLFHDCQYYWWRKPESQEKNHRPEKNEVEEVVSVVSLTSSSLRNML